MFPGLTFGSPWTLWGLLALPALAAVFAWAEHRAGVRLTRLIQTPRLRAQLTGAASAVRRRVRYGLLLLGLGGLLAALAEPRLGYETRQTHRRGLDLLVVVDVSKSMLATDLPPTRLARAKLAVQDFVTQLEGDRVGLVAFAGTAFLQAPMTVDYDAVLNAANELDTEIIPRGGTNLGGAIDLAVDAFGKAEAGNRAILLLSDGEPTTEGEQAAGLQAAQHAADAGVRIFTLGFGTPEGSLIPLGTTGEFVRDPDGKIVRTKLDESTLSALARAGNGFYVRYNGDAAVQTVLRQGLSQLKAGDINVGQTRKPIERYQWPLGFGLAFLAAAAFLGERRKVRVPLSPGPRAVPFGKRAAAALSVLLLSGLVGLPSMSRAETASTSSGQDALQLYNNKRYDEAYKAFQSLAEKNPDQGSLAFNAGASAYMGKQYDQALDAFGKAMTSNNVDLQAKANYNFGNTLFRQGEDQKERDQKVSAWKNALQHYDATLHTLKQRGPDADKQLASDTAFNRDLVQKRLDEALKEPPPPKDPSQKKDDKQDKQDRQDKQDKQDSKGQDQQKQGQDKPGENQPPEPGKDQPGKDQPGSQPPGPSGQSSPSDGKGQKPGDDKKEGSQPPGQSGKEQGSPGDKKGDNQDSRQNSPPPPGGDKPRERGDFQAKPGQGGQPPPGQPGEKPAGEPQDEAGKMNAAQARSLLDSLKDEDAHVDLGGDSKRQHPTDDPPLKDW